VKVSEEAVGRFWGFTLELRKHVMGNELHWLVLFISRHHQEVEHPILHNSERSSDHYASTNKAHVKHPPTADPPELQRVEDLLG